MRNRASLIACFFAVAATLAGAQPTPRTTDLFQIDIAEREPKRALQALADATGLQIVFGSTDVQGVFLNPVRGEMNYASALTRMLVGTGLTYRVDELTGRVVILRRDAQFDLSPRTRPR